MRAWDRLSGETCRDVLASVPALLKLIENGTVAPLKLAGLAEEHPAMKAVKKLVTDVGRVRGWWNASAPRSI